MKISPALQLVMKAASSAVTRKILHLDVPPPILRLKRKDKRRQFLFAQPS